MHQRRLISALVAVPVLCVALFNDWPVGLPLSWVLAVVFCVWACHETISLCRVVGLALYGTPLYLSAVVVPTLVFLWPHWAPPILLLVFPALSCAHLVGPIRAATASLAVHALTYLYVIVPFGALIYLRRDEGVGATLLQWLFVVSIFTDVGGFYGGKLFGRHQLAPRLSPLKTVEGAVGAIVLSVAGSVVFFLYFAHDGRTLMRAEAVAYELSWFQVILHTSAISTICQLGDAVESLLKRAAGVKDSGANLTGHGGILDRIDGLIFAAPILAMYTAYVHAG